MRKQYTKDEARSLAKKFAKEFLLDEYNNVTWKVTLYRLGRKKGQVKGVEFYSWDQGYKECVFLIRIKIFGFDNLRNKLYPICQISLKLRDVQSKIACGFSGI